MRSRIKCQTAKSAERYIGRITVCPAWMDDFDAFLRDVGPRPSPEHSIDRIDNDGNYEPGNVRWATDEQQNRNKSDNVIVAWRGRQMPLVEAVELSCLPYQTVWYRIKRAGWSIDKALTAPVRNHG